MSDARMSGYVYICMSMSLSMSVSAAFLCVYVQEAVVVGAEAATDRDDHVITAYRDHAHYMGNVVCICVCDYVCVLCTCVSATHALTLTYTYKTQVAVAQRSR